MTDTKPYAFEGAGQETPNTKLEEELRALQDLERELRARLDRVRFS